MRTIALKVYKHTAQDANGIVDVVITTFYLLKTAINNPPQGGWDVDEMRKRMRALGTLDKYEETFNFNGMVKDAPEGYMERSEALEIEDADFETFKTALKAMRWSILSQGIIETYDTFN